MPITRRSFLATLGSTGSMVGLGLWTTVLTHPGATAFAQGDPVFGPLGPADDLGIRLPAGFTSRLLARSDEAVPGTTHPWHPFPDGGGVFARPGGGWVYASNSEAVPGGGVSCISFDADGMIDDAYPILSDTIRNCAGGVTPWGTWLSCEEFGSGRVWECDPFQAGQGEARPAMGAFNHEAAVIHERTGNAYLTEDRPDGRLYRFAPTTAGDLSAGALTAARVSMTPASMVVGDIADVSWVPVSTEEGDRSPETSAFDGGEGEWMDGDRMLFTTKGDKRVWSLDLATRAGAGGASGAGAGGAGAGNVGGRLSVLHDCIATPDTPLDAVDNIVVHPMSGGIFVAEDGGNMQLCAVHERNGTVAIEAFLEIEGQDNSEIAGPDFSPDGTRLYVSSQRGKDGRGLTYEITGPFHIDPPTTPTGPPGDPIAPIGVIVDDGLRPARRIGNAEQI